MTSRRLAALHPAPGRWAVTWHTSTRRMPRFVLCTTPASREKKPSARRLSRWHTLGFRVGPIEARAYKGRTPNSCAGQRSLLRTFEAPTLYGNQEKLNTEKPDGARGSGGREDRASAARTPRRGKEKTPPFRPALQTRSASGPGCEQCARPVTRCGPQPFPHWEM